MKFLGREISLPSAFAKPPEKKRRSLGGEIGESGTEIYDGVIFEEYNQKLFGSLGLEMYDRMRKSDGTVQGALKAVKLPILRAKWFVQPASEEKQDEEIAEFVNKALFELQTITWANFLRQSLLMLDFGHMVFEKVFELRDVDGKEMVVLKKFAPRMPKTIKNWTLKNGKPGIRQLTKEAKEYEIPIEKLLIFTNEQEGDNWDGVSILRAAYKHWHFKDKFYIIDAIAFEKHGIGVPYVKMIGGTSDDDKVAATTIAKNMRAHHQAHVVHGENIEVGFIDMKAGALRDPQPSIMHHNREITKSVLAQFLELGSTDSGSRALSQDHSEMFLKSLEAVADNIIDVINRYAIPQLVDLNWNGVKAYPKLACNGISRVDVDRLANAYQTLSFAGAIHPTQADELYLRELLNLPERTEEDIEQQEDDEELARKQQNKNLEDDEFDEGKGKKKAHAHDHDAETRRRLLKFASENDYDGFRPLTFAEKKVNFKGIEREIERLERSFDVQSVRMLRQAKATFLDDLERALTEGNEEAMKAAQLNAALVYAQVLREHMSAAHAYGKNNSAREMGKEAPETPAEMRRAIAMQADTIAKSQVAEIELASKTAATEAIAKGRTVAVAVAAAGTFADRKILELTRDTSRIVTAGFMNHGRNLTFTTYGDEIYALQRSEILDADTCNYCLSIDGRVIRKGDHFAMNTIFHSGCRGIWVEILNDEEDKPEIDGIPQTLRDRFGDAVNELIQPRSPKTKKDTLARREVDRRKQA